MLHVYATFKRDYTLDFYSNIIIIILTIDSGVQSMFFVAYTCNI